MDIIIQLSATAVSETHKREWERQSLGKQARNAKKSFWKIFNGNFISL